MLTDRFQHAMRLMRRHDPQAREDGFGVLRAHAAEHLDELIAAFADERDDHGLRCLLLELIGEARSSRALPVLVAQLYSDDESLRSWAIRGLEQLDTKPARTELWKARANGLIPYPVVVLLVYLARRRPDAFGGGTRTPRKPTTPYGEGYRGTTDGGIGGDACG
jgi:hypothetical protein